MSRKILTVLAVMLVLLAVPVFANGTSEAKSSATASEGPVVIDLWYGAAVTEAGPPPADWVGFDIIREKLNIDLRLTALPSNESDQDVKIQAAGAANNLPDLFMVRRDAWIRLVQQGLVAPVDDMYELMPTRTAVQYDADSIKFTTYNGKSYGLASPGSIIKNEGVLIRKDWLDNLGLDIPVTLDDYMEVMRAFTYDDPDGNGKNDTYGYGAFIEINNYEEGLGRRFQPFYGAFGVEGTWDLNEATAGLNLKKPEMYDAMCFIKQMQDEGVIDPNWMAYKKDDFRAAWKQGKFGIMREQNAAYASKSNYAPFDANFPDGEWIVIDPPVGPEGKSSVGPYTQSYRIYAVSQKAAEAGKKEAIARLLEWMSSDEGYYLLGWGVEGENYVLDENGIPTTEGLADPSKGFDEAEIVPITQLRNMVYYNSDVELAARYPEYVCDVSGKTMSALTTLREMETKKWTASIGCDTLPAPNADVKRFYEQGVLEFLTGRRELTKENWNAWIAQFDQIGGAEWEASGIEYARENGLLI